MNVALWIAQIVLAFVYVMAGQMKFSQPRDKLQPKLPWVEDFSDRTVKMIGAFELLGGLGVVLPWLTGTAPILTPLAATGLAILMAGAVITHIRRKEPQAIAMTATLMAIAIFVAVGRFAS